ncbi:MAG TPA: hypothetical protein VND93_27420, partial [Myxococcales bacterium]|nr:hypothetical protein [Myxococcales bacterium]
TTTAPAFTDDLEAAPLLGLRAEVGSYDNFIGVNLLELRVAQSRGLSTLAGAGLPLRLTRYGAAALQPRVRIHFWKLQAFAQAGLDFELLAGQTEDGSATFKAYSAGFSGRAGLRFFAIKGLFVELDYGARLNIVYGKMPLQMGLLGGVGYAF